MRVPSATYRIQFSLNFRFADAENLVPYLHRLGISHLYSSPREKARKGSLHGYDVADPLHVNSELGTEEEFSRLVEKLKQYGMGLLLDIVPNHMAASSENRWWMDVLENGRESSYASFFDIDWVSPGAKSPELQRDRVVLPILRDLYDRVLTNQEIALRLDDKGFHLRVQGSRIPINPRTYEVFLKHSVSALKGTVPSDDSNVAALEGLLEPGISNVAIKTDLWQLYLAKPEIHRVVDETLALFNGKKGDSASFDLLNSLLSIQPYRLAYWRNAAEEVNYRRFFGLNDLVAVRVEDAQVFAATHAQVFHLLAQEKISGLRIDHIDGLRDPLEYLRRLQEATKPARVEDSTALNVYTVVEKITSGGETLPAAWLTCGTTGYDFLNEVNTLFIDPEGSWELEKFYREFTGIRSSFSDTWYVRKRQVMEDLFAADVRGLVYRLMRLASRDRLGCDLPQNELIRGLKEITACLPIYRTYCRDLKLSERDRGFLKQAFAIARRRASPASVSDAAFDFLGRVFLLTTASDAKENKEDWLDFLLRWQQFTGAVMAKGLEDTAFYVHHGLISLNEVGCNPFRKEIPFGVEAFHQFNRRVFEQHPFTLNATSTHDTKWSEDVRAVINVLSEMPNEWKRRLRRWTQFNKSKKTLMGARLAPSPNEEVLLYQSMLGVWPFEEHPNLSEIRERLEGFILKAAREAKTHSSWVSPNEDYERALRNFVSAILDSSASDRFLSDFREFARVIAPYGACNAYAQVLLKILSPGIPDIFQGNEIWNFRLTDPDNRVDVDFQQRIKLLEQFTVPRDGEACNDLGELLNNWQDGRLKLALTTRALNFRASNRDLFLRGLYLPIDVEGSKGESVCAFARCLGETWAMVVVPRLPSKVVKSGGFPVGPSAWNSSSLVLPPHAPSEWINLFTGDVLQFAASRKKQTLPVADALPQLPFAVLVHDGPETSNPS